MRHVLISALCAGSIALSTAMAAEQAAPAERVGVRIAIPYSAPAKGFVSLALYDQGGALVRNLLCAEPVEAGARSALWDATSDLGLPVRAGSYSVKSVFFSEPPS